MWDDYYDAQEHMRSGYYVIPRALDTDHFKQYVNGDFRHIHDALVKDGYL
jgi:hypothetical protein